MSTEPTVSQPTSEAPSPERAKALQSLTALNLGYDLELQGLACDPDDPDCVAEGVAGSGVSHALAVPAPEDATRSA